MEPRPNSTSPPPTPPPKNPARLNQSSSSPPPPHIPPRNPARLSQASSANLSPGTRSLMLATVQDEPNSPRATENKSSNARVESSKTKGEVIDEKEESLDEWQRGGADEESYQKLEKERIEGLEEERRAGEEMEKRVLIGRVDDLMAEDEKKKDEEEKEGDERVVMKDIDDDHVS